MPKDKRPKPAIPYIQNASPAIGSRVKVWFDKASKDLLIESETGAITRDIYGICLDDVAFDTETTARGAVRCFATGRLLAVPGTRESTEMECEIRQAARGHPDFYWWRDKKWPIAKARQAYIAPPHGGFPTSLAVDPVGAANQ
ncbi:hypothetical protein [Roseivivax sediminis]|uniref:Uncharacterized protein n=1 Tax=Roseivivax sediminis TaxID=936889 RepID=A0A1I1XQ51_9RHOB|nr:hypothetical protein [Roseivivax sediminis]SFE09447.1 hypothetical protein SAMN04515678_10693 [Roseivivax sediminis]